VRSPSSIRASVPLSLLAWLCVASAAGAQTPAASAGRVDSAMRGLTRGLEGRSTARVWTMWGPWEVGAPRVSRVGVEYDSLLSNTRLLPDSVTLPRPFPFSWVDAVQVPRHNPGGWMLRLGFLMTGAGLIYGLADKAAENPDCSPLVSPNCHKAIGIGKAALLGAGAGITIGAAVGLSVMDWKTIYRKP
jgi:hypothetical protein